MLETMALGALILMMWVLAIAMLCGLIALVCDGLQIPIGKIVRKKLGIE